MVEMSHCKKYNSECLFSGCFYVTANQSGWICLYLAALRLFWKCTFIIRLDTICVLRDTNMNNSIELWPLIFSGNVTLHFDIEFSPSYTLKGEKSIKMSDKSQPSDGPWQREHCIRRVLHNDKGEKTNFLI